MNPDTAQTDRRLNGGTALALGIVSLVAGVTSYVHMVKLAEEHGLDEWTRYAWPAAADGMTIAASLTLVQCARNGERAGIVTRLALALGVALSLWANVAAGGDVWQARVISGSAAVAFALTLEIVLRRRVLEARRSDEVHSDPARVLGEAVMLRALVERELVHSDEATGQATPAETVHPEVVHTGGGEVNGAEVNGAAGAVNGAEVNGKARAPRRRARTAAAASTGARRTARARVHTDEGGVRAQVAAAYTEQGEGLVVRQLARDLECSPSYVSRVLGDLKAEQAAAQADEPAEVSA